jgi:YVTN family beta-propeller protein
VSVIDTATDTVTNTIGVGVNPEGVAISPDGTRAYVADTGSSSISVIDTSTDSNIATVNVGAIPVGVVVISRNGSHVWVADAGSGTVSVIDTSNDSVSTITSGGSPYGVAASSDASTIYVTDRADNDLRVISAATQTITATITTGQTPQQIALTPDGSYAYIANHGDNTVSVINLATQSAGTPIPAGSAPLGIAIGTILPDPTTLTAGPGHLSLLPLGVTGLNATLTSNGTPLAGQTIDFTATGGTPLCQAVTNASGYATCNAIPPILATVSVLLGGYNATFAGTVYYKPSSAHGPLQLL